MPRQLASLQRVLAVEPIPGADRIEIATVQGWSCIVLKSENISVGDLVVYIEIDSIVPAREPFLFLEPRKYRVRTIKMKGVISQGLAMPISAFPEITKIAEGLDITELLGITKYDPEAIKEQRTSRVVDTKPHPVREFFMQFAWFRALHRYLYPGAKKGWPSFIHKTDETRIQNYGATVMAKLDEDYYITEKLDGQSGTYFVIYTKSLFGGRKPMFGVCSRNLYLKTKHACTWWNIAQQYDIERKLRSVGKEICIQGEIIGQGIQGNKYGLSGLDFYVFNVWDITKQEYYPYQDLVKFCKTLGFKMVPVVAECVKLPKTLPEIIALSKGKSVLNPKILREGIVARTMTNLPNGTPLSWKSIDGDFLLKHQDEEYADVEEDTTPA